MTVASADEIRVRWSADRSGRLVAGGAFLVAIGAVSASLTAIYLDDHWLFYGLSLAVLPVGYGAVRLGMRRSDGRAVAMAVTAAGLDVGAACSLVIPWSRVRGARTVTIEQDHEPSRFLCIDIIGAEALGMRGRSFIEKTLSGFVPDEPALTYFERDVDVDVGTIEAAINGRCGARPDGGLGRR